MTSRRDPLSRRFRVLGWCAAPVLVLGFVLGDAVVDSRHILRVTAGYGVTVDAPATDPHSPTGYEEGRRSLVLPASAADTAHWVMQTQEMLARGEWRLRHVDYDNAPDGREVHWSSLVHWWLAAMAGLDHLMSGRPIGLSVERAALFAGPVLFAALLAGLVPLLIRRFSATAAALAVIGAVTTYPFYIDFVPGHAGHHAAANICCMGTVLFLLAGCFRRAATGRDKAGTADPRERPAVRGWFVASAVAAATGLWISAATQTPVLIGVGLGLVAGTWMGRAAPQRLVWIHDPSLLRIWGLVGGGVSLAAYLIEYFPSHLGLRLEVNHPLYAVAWIGAGEALQIGTRAICDGLPSLTRRETVRGVIATAMVAALPATIAMTSSRTFVVADPFIWRLHTDYIAEFQGLIRFIISAHFSWNMVALCAPMLLLVPPLGLLLRRTTPPEAKAQLALALIPALLTLLLGWTQVRWLGLAYALSVPAFAVFFRILEWPAGGKRAAVIAWAAACGLLLVPGAVGAARRTLAGGDFTPDEIRLLAQRDVAHWLRLRAGDDRVVVASAPDTTSKLIYQGGLSGLGTLYWENAEGLKHAAALFAAPSAEAAHALVRQLGVTHIVFISWDAFEFAMVKLAHGQPESSPIPSDSFIAQLLAAPVPPPWLRALPFRLPDHPALEGQQIRIWEVTPEQTPAEAVAHSANYDLEMGKPEAAEQLASSLEDFRNHLVAAVMLAGITSRQNDAAAFSAALARVLTELPQAESLPLDDQVSLVVVLAVGQRPELAQQQLRSCMRQVNERSLRHLTPGTLSDLLALSDALGVDLPDPALKRLAERLVPPLRRK